jgi:hypothetical protein
MSAFLERVKIGRVQRVVRSLPRQRVAGASIATIAQHFGKAQLWQGALSQRTQPFRWKPSRGLRNETSLPN